MVLKGDEDEYEYEYEYTSMNIKKKDTDTKATRLKGGQFQMCLGSHVDFVDDADEDVKWALCQPAAPSSNSTAGGWLHVIWYCKRDVIV